MKYKKFCWRYSLLAFGLVSISACSASVRFLKEPDVYSTAVFDVVELALFNKYGSVTDLSKAPRYPVPTSSPAPFPACSMDEIKRINPKMVQTECRIGYGFDYAGCSDARRCIRLGFHPSVQEDSEMQKVIVKAVNNPCSLVPRPSNQVGEHWHGLAYPLRATRSVLNCEEGGRLPYEKAVLKFGEKILIIDTKRVSDE